jgi:TetR/AcrR family transcriptional regulator, regulator of cefoperazone and chloramphenicol sensitivity
MARRSRAAAESVADTRTRLIEVAARHFAEHGYRGASQREIQRELGMNPATAHYHFGSKEALYRGVVDAFIHDVQAERLQRLAQIDPKLTGRARLRRLLFDYFYPHLKLAATEAGYSYARILAQVQSEFQNAASEIFSDIVTPVRREYVGAIRAVFPEAAPADVGRALMMGVALMAIVATWRHAGTAASEETAQRQAEELSQYAAAGFEALLGKPATNAPAEKRAAGKSASPRKVARRVA